MIPKNEPPKLEEEYSEKIRDFTSKCFELKQSKRPSAKQLLSHSFILNSETTQVLRLELEKLTSNHSKIMTKATTKCADWEFEKDKSKSIGKK